MSIPTERIRAGVVPVEIWDPTSEEEDVFRYVDISSVDRHSKSILGATELAVEEAPSRARQLLKANDVLVSTVRPNLNAVAMVPDNFDGSVGSTGFTVLRANPKRLLPEYLFHWVRTPAFVAEMVKHATGASYPAVSDRIVLDSEIPALPLAEQRRIADILDKADAIRRKRKESIALTEDLLRSTFLEMFGDPVTNPKGWPARPFEDVVRDATSGNPKLPQAKYESQGRFPVIDQGAEFIGGWTSSEDLVARLELPAVLFGDHTKALKWVERPFVLGADGVKILVPRDGLLSEYVYMACSMFPFPDVGYSRHFKFLKLWNVPVPPVDRQRRFAMMFGRIRAGLPLRATAAKEAEDLFNSLVARAFSNSMGHSQ